MILRATMQVAYSGETGGGEASHRSASVLLMEAQQAEAAESLEGGHAARSCLIDSLPYVDRVDEGLRARAEELIEAELQTLPKVPSDYLRELPRADEFDFGKCPLSEEAYLRAGGAGDEGSTAGALDVTRYALEEPAGKDARSAAAWRDAVANASSQLEHQQVRVENLELLLQSGAAVWRAANARAEGLCGRVESVAGGLANEAEALNRERKLQQFSSGNQIHSLEQAWYGQVHKNAEVQAACNHLERQLQRS